MVDVSKFKDLFISEAEDHLQKLNDNLLSLEKKPDEKELLHELMRSSHTLKSSSATMGYTSMAYLMHVMEDVFDYARKDLLKIDLEIINELFATFDAINNSLESIKDTGKEVDLNDRIEVIKRITNVQTEGFSKSERAEDVKTPASSGSTTNQTNSPTTKPADKKSSSNEQDDAVIEIEHIKVPVKRLDLLFDLVEELLIDKMRLESLAGDNLELKGVVNHLERLVSDIQYQVTQARLVPVDQIFARFPRMVRDLSIREKKKIDLQISGGDIELDRTIIDKLGNPLVHLLRNAIDHGIVTEGVIKLSVVRERDYALVSVEDNGNGIKYERVREEAIKRGVYSAAEAADLSRGQLIELLFNPQFSTAEKVTDISGRGVGLSAVKEFANEIGGEIRVESPPKDLIRPDGTVPDHAGTRFTLELPLTLAIVNSLLVTVGSQMFAIPFSNIVRAIQVPLGDVKSMGDQNVAVVNDEYVTLVHLDKLFEIKDAKVVEDKITVVLIRKGAELAGIVVDGLRDEQEIIVKPLPDSLKGVPGFSGSTILGDGRTIMILDIAGLLADSAKFIRVVN